MATRKSTTPKRIPFATVKQQYAEKRGIELNTPESVRAEKSMRAYMRANKGDLAKLDPELAKHEHGAPYPALLPVAAKAIIERSV